jgi:type I restriction enzyme R subunit
LIAGWTDDETGLITEGLAVGIGWRPITPEVAKQKRGGEASMLLRDELEAGLAKFNPWMSSDAIRQVMEKLESIPPTIEGNREMLAWLRGERQWYDEAEKRHRHVQIVDFETPGENVFHVTWEWKLKPPARKGNRADVVFVVNGVPICIVEHKNPMDGGGIIEA